MNKVLTRAEMEAQFDGEWVLVADPEMDQDSEVLRGRVVYHGEDREAVYQKAESHPSKRWASLYFGEMPEHIWLNDWHSIGAALEHGTTAPTDRIYSRN